MILAKGLHPAPPAPMPGSSLMAWIWLTVILAVIVAGGLVLASRR
jgi:hypothetical protein